MKMRYTGGRKERHNSAPADHVGQPSCGAASLDALIGKAVCFAVNRSLGASKVTRTDVRGGEIYRRRLRDDLAWANLPKTSVEQRVRGSTESSKFPICAGIRIN